MRWRAPAACWPDLPQRQAEDGVKFRPMALQDLYQQIILEHNRQPRHFGRLAGATHSARGQDALCGDDVLVELRVCGGIVEAAGFSGEACAITTASASMLSDWLGGRSIEDFTSAFATFRQLLSDASVGDSGDLGEINALRAVSDYPARVRNALLPWHAVHKALTVQS